MVEIPGDVGPTFRLGIYDPEAVLDAARAESGVEHWSPAAMAAHLSVNSADLMWKLMDVMTRLGELVEVPLAGKDGYPLYALPPRRVTRSGE